MVSIEYLLTNRNQRVIDNIPLTIQQSLCQKLSETLQGHLIDELKLGEPDASKRFEELVAEDPSVEAERKELEFLKKKLSEIRDKLSSF